MFKLSTLEAFPAMGSEFGAICVKVKQKVNK
jgi:hypothetical protein